MSLSRRQFTQEFKLAAVRRLEQGVSIAEVIANVARGLTIRSDLLKGKNAVFVLESAHEAEIAEMSTV